jgi:uncharacterized membrane protein
MNTYVQILSSVREQVCLSLGFSNCGVRTAIGLVCAHCYWSVVCALLLVCSARTATGLLCAHCYWSGVHALLLVCSVRTAIGLVCAHCYWPVVCTLLPVQQPYCCQYSKHCFWYVALKI